MIDIKCDECKKVIDVGEDCYCFTCWTESVKASIMAQERISEQKQQIADLQREVDNLKRKLAEAQETENLRSEKGR